MISRAMQISTGAHSNPVSPPKIPFTSFRQLNPNAPPFTPRPAAPPPTAARKKSLRMLMLFPLYLKFRKPNNAQSAAIRIRRKELVKTIRLKRELKELRREVFRMIDSAEARREALFKLALAAHSITSSQPPAAKGPPKSGTKRKHSRSPPPMQPPPLAHAPKRKRSRSPPPGTCIPAASIPKRKRSPSPPPASPPPAACTTKHMHSPPQPVPHPPALPSSTTPTFKGFKKGWFDKL